MATESSTYRAGGSGTRAAAPTVEAEVRSAGGASARHRAGRRLDRPARRVDLRDGGAAFGGLDVRRARRQHQRPASRRRCAAMNAADQAAIDRRLIELDGTPTRPGSAATPSSPCRWPCAHADAAARKLPLWKHLAGERRGRAARCRRSRSSAAAPTPARASTSRISWSSAPAPAASRRRWNGPRRSIAPPGAPRRGAGRCTAWPTRAATGRRSSRTRRRWPSSSARSPAPASSRATTSAIALDIAASPASAARALPPCARGRALSSRAAARDAAALDRALPDRLGRGSVRRGRCRMRAFTGGSAPRAGGRRRLLRHLAGRVRAGRRRRLQHRAAQAEPGRHGERDLRLLGGGA